MEMTGYNPHKGRLETIVVALTDENTTWFDDCVAADDIAVITDFDGDLLIRENNWSYPVRIYDVSRKSIGYDREKAKELQQRFLL